MCEQRIPERSSGELNALVRREGDTNNLSGIEIDDRGEIQFLASPPDLSEVGSPNVTLAERHSREQEIGIDHGYLAFKPFLHSAAVCLDAEEIHHSFDLLVIAVQCK